MAKKLELEMLQTRVGGGLRVGHDGVEFGNHPQELAPSGEQNLLKRVPKDVYLSVLEVARLFGVARCTVEALPMEILPFVDLSPSPNRQLKRFHPLDVVAAEPRLREWQTAKQAGEGEAFLAEQRRLLEERDRAALDLAQHRAREDA